MRHRDTSWLFVTRDAIRRTWVVPGDDETIIERLVISHPYLDIYPPLTLREWDEHVRKMEGPPHDRPHRS